MLAPSATNVELAKSRFRSFSPWKTDCVQVPWAVPAYFKNWNRQIRNHAAKINQMRTLKSSDWGALQCSAPLHHSLCVWMYLVGALCIMRRRLEYTQASRLTIENLCTYRSITKFAWVFIELEIISPQSFQQWIFYPEDLTAWRA